MVIITVSPLYECAHKHPTSLGPLNDWIEKTKAADWRHFPDVKKTFNSADSVGNDRYVFDIKNNDFRIITMIHFSTRTVYIRFVGPHAEYDKIDASTA